MIEFLPGTCLISDDDIDRFVFPWIYAAGNPYYDWFFGGETIAGEKLREWFHDKKAEVSLHRVRLMSVDGDIVGGFVAMTGADLKRRRKADLLSLVKFKKMERAVLMAKLEASQGAFPEPGPDEFYLSKVGVLTSHRGQGLGRRLMEQYLKEGDDMGVSGYQLDVSVANRAAITLYRRYGFTTLSEQSIGETGIEYQTLRLRGQAPERSPQGVRC